MTNGMTVAGPPAWLDELVGRVAGHGLRAAPDDGVVDRPPTGGQWAQILGACRRHRLLGLLHQAWVDGAVRLGPAQEEELRGLHRSQRLACIQIEHHLLKTVDRLGREGIDVRVLKGVAVAHLDYEDPAWRPFHDADVLVRSRDVDRAVALLERDGARRRYPEPRPGFDREFSKGSCVVLPNGCEIDVHRTIAPGWFGLRVDLDELFEGGRPFDLNGTELVALSRDRALVHACYHAVLGSAIPTRITQRDIVTMVLADERVGDRARDLAARWDGTPVLATAICAAWEAIAPPATPAIVCWARAWQPTRPERRRLATYQGTGRSGVRQSVGAVLAIESTGARIRYLRALAAPRRSDVGAVERWRRAWRSLGRE